jgi:hypothetical protein
MLPYHRVKRIGRRDPDAEGRVVVAEALARPVGPEVLP